MLDRVGQSGETFLQQRPLAGGVAVVVVQWVRPEHEQRAGVLEVVGGVHPGDPVNVDVQVRITLVGKRFGYRDHRQVGAEEIGESGFVAEQQVAHAGVQPVGADHEVVAVGPAAGERDVAVLGQGGDVVAEPIVDVLAPGVVVDLREVVSHDLDMPVRHGREDRVVVDDDVPPRTAALQHQSIRAGRMVHDRREHTHPFGDVHGRSEQVDGVAAGLAQCRGTFDHGHVEAAPRQPVGQHRSGDAGAGDQNAHHALLT